MSTINVSSVMLESKTFENLKLTENMKKQKMKIRKKAQVRQKINRGINLVVELILRMPFCQHNMCISSFW